MSRRDDLTRASDLFMQAAFRPEALRDALAFAARLFGGEGGQIITVDGLGRLLASVETGMDTVGLAQQAEYIPHSPRFHNMARMGEGDVTYDYDGLTPEALARNRVYQEFLKPNNVDWYAGSVLLRTAEESVGFALFREDRGGHFSARELADYARLSDSVAAALRLRRAFDQQRLDGRFEALESAAGAVALIGPDGALLRCSEPFAALMRARDGRAVFSMDRNKRLLDTASPALRDWLRGHLATLAGGGHLSARALGAGATTGPREPSASFVVERPDGDVVLSAHRLQAAAEWGYARPSLFLTARALQGQSVEPSLLVALFGMTLAEARLASSLGTGMAMRDAARANGVTYETARSYAKIAYAKTGSSRQAEWVARASILAGLG